MSDHPDQSTSHSWLEDDPLVSTSSPRDALDREPFVQAVAGVMRRAYKPGGSTVFGLIGPWGSGKTSVINMLTRELQSPDAGHLPWQVAAFNPWGYGDQLSLQWGFFAELRAAVPAGKQWRDAKKTLDTLRKFTAPAASLANIAYAGSKNIADAALNFFETSPTKARQAAEAALRTLDEPIVIVIDDLDRLSSSELLEVFKLVRFTGRLPNLYYLLSYDEQTLLDLLEKTDLVGTPHDGRALDYLEKIVQVRFDLPPLLPELAQREFDDGLTSILAGLEMAVSDQDAGRLAHVFTTSLRYRLDTPRAIRRFLGQVEAFLPPVANEVDWVHFVMLSWIRTFEPVLYSQLQPHKELLLGSKVSYGMSQASKDTEKQTEVKAMLAASNLDPATESRTVRLLGDLFPVVRNAAGQGQVAEQSTERGYINNPDYFDRFFQFGVPAADISDVIVSKALRDIAEGIPSNAAERLEEQFAHFTDRALRKLHYESSRSGIDAGVVARWVAARYDSVDKNDGTFFNPQTNVENYFAELLLELEADGASVLICEVVGDVATATLVVSAVALLARKQFGGTAEIAAANELGRVLTDRAATQAHEHVVQAIVGAASVFDVSPEVWQLIWRWYDLREDQVRSFFATRVGDGTWSALDVLSRFVVASVPLGVVNARGRLSGLNEELASRVLDLDALTTEFGTEVAGAGPVPIDRTLVDSPENRRQYALAWLRARADRPQP